MHLRQQKVTVLPMSPAFDVVIGNDWLEKYDTIMHIAQRKLVLHDRTCPGNLTIHKLLGTPPRHTNATSAETISSAQADLPEKLPVISAMQVRRHILNGDRILLTIVKESSDTQLSSASSVVNDILNEYSDVFPTELPGLPPDREYHVTIDLEPGHKIPNRPMYRYSPRELEEMQRYINELLSKDLIQPSTSPFGSPVIFVPKPDGTLRMCHDYRAINRITVKNASPLPRIDDLFDKLGGAKIFSSMDLMQGYYQMRIKPSDTHKTAFKTPMGLYEFKVLPLGLTNAPAAFMAQMNHIFKDVIGKFVLVYLDDILIYSKSVEEHLQHVKHVLDLLRKHKFYCKQS
jgi:hypothetical protein